MASLKPTNGPGAAVDGKLVIGLVNNMPDAALRTTEGQFRAVLSATALAEHIDLRCFYLRDVPRSARAASWLEHYNEPVERLYASSVDALIVTGNEPRAASIVDEPYWQSLTRLADWAEDNTISTVWSCLAAHAAVLHLDGIPRRRLPGKLSGVFRCRATSDHPLLAGAEALRHVPHSRYNEVAATELLLRGYRLLSVSEQAGADMFIREGNSLFVFLQGHPEYDPLALLREYRRDVMRYLRRERDTYPDMPQNYFDSPTEATLDMFRIQAISGNRGELQSTLQVFIGAAAAADTWSAASGRLFANWLSYLMARKSMFVPSFALASRAMERAGGV